MFLEDRPDALACCCPKTAWLTDVRLRASANGIFAQQPSQHRTRQPCKYYETDNTAIGLSQPQRVPEAQGHRRELSGTGARVAAGMHVCTVPRQIYAGRAVPKERSPAGFCRARAGPIPRRGLAYPSSSKSPGRRTPPCLASSLLASPLFASIVCPLRHPPFVHPYRASVSRIRIAHPYRASVSGIGDGQDGSGPPLLVGRWENVWVATPSAAKSGTSLLCSCSPTTSAAQRLPWALPLRAARPLRTRCWAAPRCPIPHPPPRIASSLELPPPPAFCERGPPKNHAARRLTLSDRHAASHVADRAPRRRHCRRVRRRLGLQAPRVQPVAFLRCRGRRAEGAPATAHQCRSRADQTDAAAQRLHLVAGFRRASPRRPREARQLWVAGRAHLPIAKPAPASQQRRRRATRPVAVRRRHPGHAAGAKHPAGGGRRTASQDNQPRDEQPAAPHGVADGERGPGNVVRRRGRGKPLERAESRCRHGAPGKRRTHGRTAEQQELVDKLLVSFEGPRRIATCESTCDADGASCRAAADVCCDDVAAPVSTPRRAAPPATPPAAI